VKKKVVNAGRTYYPLVFQLTIMKIALWKGNLMLDTNTKLNILATSFSQTKLNFFLQSKGPSLLNILSVAHPLFWRNFPRLDLATYSHIINWL
jgi:hypothetical protein